MADSKIIAANIFEYMKDKCDTSIYNFYIAFTYQNKALFTIYRINTNKYLLKCKERTCPHIESESYDVKKFTKEDKYEICTIFEEFILDILHNDFDSYPEDSDYDSIYICFNFMVCKFAEESEQYDDRKITCNVIPINQVLNNDSDMSLDSSSTDESDESDDNSNQCQRGRFYVNKVVVVYKNNIRFFELIEVNDDKYKKKSKQIRNIVQKKFSNVWSIFETLYKL